MPKKTAFKITGDNFEDFAPVVHALWEDGLLLTAHLADDDKDWLATTDTDSDKDAVQGVVDSVDLEGKVTVVALDVEEDDDVNDDGEEDEG